MKIGALALVALFALILVKPVIPYIHYAVRKKFIIEEYCVNKPVPEKQCNGKCHLEKQVKKSVEDPKQNDMPLPSEREKEEILKYLAAGYADENLFQVERTAVSGYLGSYSFDFVSSIFHPPMKDSESL